MLMPDGYQPRMIEKRLDALMRAFGCVELVGPKWCKPGRRFRVRPA